MVNQKIFFVQFLFVKLEKGLEESNYGKKIKRLYRIDMWMLESN